MRSFIDSTNTEYLLHANVVLSSGDILINKIRKEIPALKKLAFLINSND